MYLKKIYLSNFRNYDELLLTLKKGINIIYGNNAQGKTNLLESIYVLALTKSHRSFIDNNLIKIGQKYSQIKGIMENFNVDTTYEIILEKTKKTIKINDDIVKSISDYISNINIVIFYPEDLELIKGSPNVRRRFLNLEIGQLNGKYLTILSEYNKILKLRNDYIKLINQGEKCDMNYFNILTSYYIDKSIMLYQERNKFIELLNKESQKIFKDISGLDGFHIVYKTSFSFDNYETSKMKQIMEDKVKRMFNYEIKVKTTLLGPHKDDIEFYIENTAIKNYGSQGQQRIAVLSVKLSEIRIFKEKTGKSPILLLDDVFSELDSIKKNNLLNYIQSDMQTIITTTDLNNINEQIINNAKLIKISEGKIQQITEVN